jgi:predicted DNA-binding protein (MmcQ/YjbR family)
MNIEEFREYCLSKAGVEESFPFDEETLVFKVMGKMFVLCGLEKSDFSFNVKCDPDLAIELREKYPESILPGYHMSKTHWNTVMANYGLSDHQLKEFIDHSYELVASGLTKKQKEELQKLATS